MSVLYWPNLENHNDGNTPDKDGHMTEENKCWYCKGKGRILVKFITLDYIRELNRSKEIKLPAYIECKHCGCCGFHG